MLSVLGTFSFAYATLLLLPGPNLAVVMQACLSRNPRDAARVVAGVAGGAAMLAFGSAFAVAWMTPGSVMVALVHGLFACLLARAAWLSLGRALRAQSVQAAAASSERHGLAAGFLTAASNPVSAAFFAGFAVSTQAALDIRLATAIAATVFAMVAIWFTIVACLVCGCGARSCYARFGRFMDAAIGLFLMVLACKAGVTLLAS